MKKYTFKDVDEKTKEYDAEELGKGGVGEVYLVEENGKKSALKVQYAGDENAFRNNAIKSTSLDGFVKIQQIGKAQETGVTGFKQALLMEYCPSNLRELYDACDRVAPVEEHDPANLNLRKVLMYRTLLSVVNTLEGIHNGKHIAHQDLKPSNILCRYDGKPATKITGLGELEKVVCGCDIVLSDPAFHDPLLTLSLSYFKPGTGGNAGNGGGNQSSGQEGKQQISAELVRQIKERMYFIGTGLETGEEKDIFSLLALWSWMADGHFEGHVPSFAKDKGFALRYAKKKAWLKMPTLAEVKKKLQEETPDNGSYFIRNGLYVYRPIDKFREEFGGKKQSDRDALMRLFSRYNEMKSRSGVGSSEGSALQTEFYERLLVSATQLKKELGEKSTSALEPSNRLKDKKTEANNLDTEIAGIEGKIKTKMGEINTATSKSDLPVDKVISSANQLAELKKQHEAKKTERGKVSGEIKNLVGTLSPFKIDNEKAALDYIKATCLPELSAIEKDKQKELENLL